MRTSNQEATLTERKRSVKQYTRNSGGSASSTSASAKRNSSRAPGTARRRARQSATRRHARITASSTAAAAARAISHGAQAESRLRSVSASPVNSSDAPNRTLKATIGSKAS